MDGDHKTREEYIEHMMSICPQYGKEHISNMWEHFFLIPEDKDTSNIPKGDYCYKYVDGKNKYGIPNTENCPYHSYKELNGAGVVWCDYLELGGLPNDCKEGDHEKLIEFFGSTEAMLSSLPLTLLFDSCKECGINKYTDEGFIEHS